MGHGPSEINAFLKARRAALGPAEVGLPDGTGRRRVRGLRREEVAQRAGISVDYYTRIEQGRARTVSDAVLDAVARALRLTPAEHAYLRNITLPRRSSQLADPPRGRHAADPGAPARDPQPFPPEARQVLDALDGAAPAFLYGPAHDLLAWNRLAARVSFDLDALPDHRRNAALLLFLHPDARALHPDWEEAAQETVASLRAETGRRAAGHPRLCEVISELHERSEDFRRHWAAQAVTERSRGTKRIMNPLVGELVVSYQVFTLPGDPDLTLCTYTAPRDTPTAKALRALAELTPTGLIDG